MKAAAAAQRGGGPLGFCRTEKALCSMRAKQWRRVPGTMESFGAQGKSIAHVHPRNDPGPPKGETGGLTRAHLEWGEKRKETHVETRLGPTQQNSRPCFDLGESRQTSRRRGNAGDERFLPGKRGGSVSQTQPERSVHPSPLPVKTSSGNEEK